MSNDEWLQFITRERPVGTKINEEIIDRLEEDFKAAGYEIISLPFECLSWQKGKSQLKMGNTVFELSVSPFSKAFRGSGEAVILETLDELKQKDLKGKIAILCGQLAEQPLQPKDFPFYYPEEDKAVISLLEQKEPRAIIAVTGKSQLSGMNPFPLFEDGNFLIPSTYMSKDRIEQLRELINRKTEVLLNIDSEVTIKQARQLAARKKGIEGKKKIMVCAHMDTKYNTPGALDNAAGLCVLMQLMDILKGEDIPVEFVPFNSEEYFSAGGEVSYLNWSKSQQDKISLVINIDSPCHTHSETAISYYNLNEGQQAVIDRMIEKEKKIIKGEPWYAGDHCAFVFQGFPCLAVTSSDLFEGGLEYTHTPEDTLETVGAALIGKTAKFLAELIKNWSYKENE